jgi:hypothetical protein
MEEPSFILATLAFKGPYREIPDAFKNTSQELSAVTGRRPTPKDIPVGDDFDLPEVQEAHRYTEAKVKLIRIGISFHSLPTNRPPLQRTIDGV